MKKHASQSISACLVIYNEEAVLDRCLASLKGVDEIIVVHDGPCGDSSLEIARRYTNNVFVKPHVGIGEPYRVFAMEQATGSWILQVDADEFLSDELRAALPSLVADAKVDAYAMVWPFWNGQKYYTKNWPFKPILFRTSKLSFLGFPQEPLRTSGLLKNSLLVLEHRPKYYNLTWKRVSTKWMAWAHIQARYCLMPYDSILKFKINDTDWTPKFRLARDHAYLFPLIGLYCGLTTLVSGGWHQGLVGWKQSLFWGYYNAAVYYWIFYYQRHPESA